MDWLNHNVAVLTEILVAVILSGAIGYERELAQRPAGLRTHMLVAASATLIIGLGETLVANFSGYPQLNFDPNRLIEAVVVGVSFLGAGTILQRQKDMHVEGLTTAASLLFTAVIGISVGLNQFVLAIGAVVITLLITRGGGWLIGRYSPKEHTPKVEE